MNAKKFLIGVGPLPSHLDAAAPVARRLISAGHDALIAAPPNLRTLTTDRYGLRFEKAGGDWTNDCGIGSDLALSFAEGGNARFLERVFHHAATTVAEMATDLRRIIAAYGPDALLHDSSDIGSYVAAAGLVPSVAIDNGVSPYTDGIGERVRELRQSFHNGPSSEPLLTPAPAGLLLAGPNIHHYRHEDRTRHGERLPAWADRLPHDRPLVYVSLGSLLPNAPGMAGIVSATLVRIVKALERMPVTAIISTGAASYDKVSEESEDLPHVHITPHAPQTLWLRRADVFLTHCGFSSLREGLVNDVVFVALPITTDQPGNAARLAGHRLAVPLTLMSDQSAIAEAIDTALHDPSYREACREWRDRMNALPTFDQVLADVLRAA